MESRHPQELSPAGIFSSSMLMFGLVVIHLMSSYCVWVCWSAIPHHLVSARVVSHGPCSVDEPFPSTFRKKASKRCLKINFLWCTPSSKLQVNENTWTCHFPNLWPMFFRTKKNGFRDRPPRPVPLQHSRRMLRAEAWYAWDLRLSKRWVRPWDICFFVSFLFLQKII